MIAVHIQTLKESDFVHVASTMEKAIAWVVKHGQDWCEEHYCFFAYTVEVDKEGYVENGTDDAYYIDVNGIASKENPLLND